MHAVGVLDGKYRDDVRMIERGHRSGFTLETHQTLRIPRHLRRQNLQRHLAAQLRVRSAIYLAHAASPNSRRDVVMRECPVDQRKPPASHQATKRGAISAKPKPILHQAPSRPGESHYQTSGFQTKFTRAINATIVCYDLKHIRFVRLRTLVISLNEKK